MKNRMTANLTNRTLMTEEEDRQKKWVELRAACTRQGVFDQLVDVIKCDLKRFNALDPDKRGSVTFGHERRDRKTIGIGLNSSRGVLFGKEDDCVWLRATAIGIDVYRKEAVAFEIDQRWNEETLTCDMLIGDECYSIWQISQKAIGDLLFCEHP